MRKVFLESLPHGGAKYIPENRINWKASIGESLRFVYDEIEGELAIVDYISEKSRVKVKYKNKEYEIYSGDLKDCKIRRILGLLSKEHRYKIGDIVNVKSGDILITNHIEKRNGNKGYVRAYEYQCLKCESKNTITEGHLKERLGCPYCWNNKVKVGLNDIWTTNPDLAALLSNPEDGHKYTQSSNKKVDWKCPKCKSIVKNRVISSINSKGLACGACSDNISYPEKFMFNMLQQLNCEFETQKSFAWSNNRRYDFYIDSKNTIIEVHGMQHYKRCFLNSIRTLEEEKDNDILKKKTARDNGIKNYIVIDARISEMEFIKSSILNSDLKKIFDLQNINWNLCHKFSCGSVVKIACELWSKGIHSPSLIGEKLKVDASTVRKYLKKGRIIGWCDYSIEKTYKFAAKEKSKLRMRRVIRLSLKGDYISEYSSINEAISVTGITKISSCCRGYQKTAGGYKWMYKEDYDKYIEQKNAI